MALVKEIIPVKGKKIRNDVFPNKPLPEDKPTRVVWNAYWMKRLTAGDVELYTGKQAASAEAEVAETSTDKTVSEDSKPKSKKSKAQKEY